MDTIGNEPFTKYLLPLNALSQCNTSSLLFGKGKSKFCKVKDSNEEYWAAVDLFTKSGLSKQILASAGRIILLTVYRNSQEDDVE